MTIAMAQLSSCLSAFARRTSDISVMKQKLKAASIFRAHQEIFIYLFIYFTGSVLLPGYNEDLCIPSNNPYPEPNQPNSSY